MSRMSDNNALEQARAQAESIAAMVGALNVDYDRLEELRELNADMAASEEEDEELRELEDAANGNTSEEEAYRKAAEALRDKMKWQGDLIGGCMPGNAGYCFVFAK